MESKNTRQTEEFDKRISTKIKIYHLIFKNGTIKYVNNWFCVIHLSGLKLRNTFIFINKSILYLSDIHLTRIEYKLRT